MSKQSLGKWLGFIVIGLILAAWLIPSIGWAWLIVAIILLIFTSVLGSAISGRWLGILITEQNTMSLARFQAVLWTLIVISAFFVIAVTRTKNQDKIVKVATAPPSARLAGGASPTPSATPSISRPPDPLSITLNNQLLALIGISATALVGSPLIAATKKSKAPDNADPQIATADKTATMDKTTAAAAPPAVAPNKAEGILFKNEHITDARFSDIFEGDELANNNHIDLGKVQMFYFTLMVAIAYVVALYQAMTPENLYASSFAFPEFSSGAVALLGISNAGYLANKGVDHTKTNT